MSRWNENKLFTEATNGDNRVAVYVGTYGKYNDGSIEGQWVYPADYDTREDFLSYCAEVVHEDEYDPELMFQDVENLPEYFYSESGFDDEAFDYAKWVDDNPGRQEAAEAFIELYGHWDETEFEDRYCGEWDSVEDFAWHFVDEMGGVGQISNLEYYFDYDHFGHELKWDFTEEDEEIYGDMEDAECAEQWIEDVYGSIEGLAEASPETIENYFDMSAYARDLEVSGDVDWYDGHIFWGNY